MSDFNETYKDKKVMSIGTVKELTGLSERQIRYYEERKLVFPERSQTGIRKYSFIDIELLVMISNKIEEGVWTNEIKKELKSLDQQPLSNKEIRDSLLKGQFNVQFNV